MLKISKSFIEFIEKSSLKNDEVWKQLNSFWLANIGEYRVLDKLPDDFLVRVRNLLSRVYEEELAKIDKSIWFAESFEDDVIEMLLEQYINKLKNSKTRLVKNASVIHMIDDRLRINGKTKME